jgi:hypothetical protein
MMGSRYGMAYSERIQSEIIMEIFKNVLTKEEQEYVINSTINSNRWGFSQRSDGGNPNNYIFWSLDLNEDKFFREIFFEKIKKLTGKNFYIERIYANGQTYGLPGSFHADTYDPKGRTFIYYVNPVWNADWGGETVFYINNTPIIIFPTPNSAVFFDGNIEHFGKDPTRKTNLLRVTVAFKLIEKE